MKPINPLFFKIIRYYSPKTNAKQGFVLPMMIGLGLIMTVVGLTMIGRSSDDQQTAISQNQTAQSLAAAETGITRTLAFLNQPQNSDYLEFNYDATEGANPDNDQNPWSEKYEANGDQQFCDGNPFNNQPEDRDNLIQGDINGEATYQVMSYEVDDFDNPAEGTLEIRAEMNNGSKSQVSVDLNINPRENIPFPGMYMRENIDLGNNDFLDVVSDDNNANIICAECNDDFDPSEHCDNSGALTDKGLSDLFTKKNATIDGDGFLGNLEIDEVPQPPSNNQLANDYNGGDLRSISGDETLPRKNDTPSDGIYHYRIKSIDLGGGDTLTINTNDAPVYLYVSENVTIKGNPEIDHKGSFGDFRIYGNPEGGDSQDIKLSGTPSAGAFVYAPEANMGINGNGTFKGVIWAKEWGLSSSNSADIKVPSDNEVAGLLQEFSLLTNSPSSPTNWQRQPVQNNDSGES